MLQIASIILGSLITLMVTFFTNSEANKRMMIQFKEERSRKDKEDMRKRAEDLYVALTSWSNAVTSYCMLMIPALTGELGINTVLDMQHDHATKIQDKYDFARIEMAIRADFPSLAGTFAKLLALRDSLTETVAEYKAELKSSSSLRSFAPLVDFQDQIEQFGMLADQLKGEIILELAVVKSK
jgi:hypothetical protein